MRLWRVNRDYIDCVSFGIASGGERFDSAVGAVSPSTDVRRRNLCKDDFGLDALEYREKR